MKIYCNNQQKVKLDNKYLNPLVKNILLSAGNNHQISTENLNEADFATLPYVYAYYFFNNKIKSIENYAKKCAISNKKLVIWHSGDLSPARTINVVYLQTAVDRSKNESFRCPIPYFIDDPLKNIVADFYYREITKKPKVGFCGFASQGRAKIGYGLPMNLKNNFLRKLRPDGYVQDLTLPAVLLRGKVLKTITNDPRIDDNFIIRKSYKEGISKSATKHNAVDKNVIEFYNNILNNQYTVCVRGYGNFSIRFYETMASGRIPIIIDTDIRLPFDETIDYTQHCVWIPRSKIKNLGDILLDFHSKLDGSKITRLQASNRKIWEDYLSFTGFFEQFENKLLTKILK